MYPAVLPSLTRNKVSTVSHFSKLTGINAALSYITTFSIFLRVGIDFVVVPAAGAGVSPS